EYVAKNRCVASARKLKKQGSTQSLLFQEDELFLRAFNAGLALYYEDNTFADITTMVGNPLKLVSNPEQIGGALQNVCIILQGRDGTSASKHRHQIMTYQVIAHIHNVIFLPDVPCGIDITSRKCLHCPL